MGLNKSALYTLCEMCPNKEIFWSVFSHIWTEYGPEKTPYLDTFHAVTVSNDICDLKNLI